MTGPFWEDQGTPADRPDVLAAVPAGAGLDVFVRYENGALWRSAPDGTDPWVPLSPPPGGGIVLPVAGWAASGGAVLMALGGAEETVRVTSGAAGDVRWVDLGRPFVEGGMHGVAVVEVPDPAAPSRWTALLIREVLWMRVDPLDGTPAEPTAWERIDTPEGTAATEVGAVAVGDAASGATGAVVVVLRDDMTETGLRRLGILTRQDGAWGWTDPGPAPGGIDVGDLVVGSLPGADGTVAGAAVAGYDVLSRAVTAVAVLRGARNSWEWSVLARPPGEAFAVPVGLSSAADPATGDVTPVVLVRVHDGGFAGLWWSGLDGRTTRLGGPAGDVPVWNVAVCRGAPAGPLAVVGSSGHRLWTVRLEAGGPSWRELPALPSTVADVVGGLADWDDPPAPERGFHLFTVGADGRLWDRWWNGEWWSWVDHGRPGPTVLARSGVGAVADLASSGAHAVVLGSDGRLWHRCRAGAGWSWVDHGIPGGVPIQDAAPPVLVGSELHLVVRDRDGDVWVRRPVGDGWRWERRSSPPGTTTFGLVGAGVGRPPTGGPEGAIAFVITADGVVWSSWTDGGPDPRWTSLDAPAPGLGASAGLGVVPVGPEPADPRGLVVMVQDRTIQHVHAATWPAAAWADIRPPEGGIAGAIGAVTDPDDPGIAAVFVVGRDGHLWVLRHGIGPSRWEDRGVLPATGRVRGRAVVAAIRDHSPFTRLRPIAPVRSDDGRLVIGWPG